MQAEMAVGLKELGNTPVQAVNWVNGKGVRSSPVETVFSPYSGGKIGEVHYANRTLVEEAIRYASQAQIAWASNPIKERTKILFQFRQILLERQDQIAKVKALESGKLFSEAKAGLMKGIEVLEFALSLQNLDIGGKMEVSRGVSCEYRREALGVVANITPFNFPGMVPLWTLPIAMVLGNAYVWKPSERVPLTSQLLAEAFYDAGLPAGVLTVLHGGVETVQAIVDDDAIRAIGFVGSTPVAESLYRSASQKLKRALCLGGAKNHIVLLPDAHAELTGPGISDSFTGCAGQRCMAASVVLAVGDNDTRIDSHIQKIVSRAAGLELGKTMGAIITKHQREFLIKAIERAEKAGAKVLLDGRKAQAPKEFSGGNWLGPTILDQVDPKSEAATQELFGPILSIVRCKTISEAMEIENANPFGNACSVFTASGALAEQVIGMAKAGMVGVNVGVPVPREPFSFGGIRVSKFGHGDITGRTSLEFWSQLKKVTVKWEPQKDSNWMS